VMNSGALYIYAIYIYYIFILYPDADTLSHAPSLIPAPVGLIAWTI
jgi:hypothetical protein